jgi:hypothetical protein
MRLPVWVGSKAVSYRKIGMLRKQPGKPAQSKGEIVAKGSIAVQKDTHTAFL